VIQGAVVPRYEEYMYFYLTNENYMQFSKMTYAYLKMASFFGVILGSALYSMFLKHLSIRWMMALACSVNVVASIGQTLFLKGYYLGMNPVVFYGIVELISDSFIQAFVWLPALAIVSKLIPATIEVALFAFFTGLNNLNLHFIGRLTGNLINSLTVKATNADLGGLWILHLI